jgi:hypothetical protein
MARWQLIKLNFKDNPVHFGEVGIGLEVTSEYLHSDTFFRSIIYSINFSPPAHHFRSVLPLSMAKIKTVNVFTTYPACFNTPEITPLMI